MQIVSNFLRAITELAARRQRKDLAPYCAAQVSESLARFNI